MPEALPKYTFDRVVRMVLGAAIFVAVLWLLRFLSDVLLPFAAAVVLAYLLNPLVNLFESRTRRRGLAVAMTIFGIFVVGAALLAIVIPVVYWQFDRFGKDLEKFRDDLTESWILATTTSAETADETDPTSSQSDSNLPESVADVVEEGAANAEKVDAKSAFGWRELLAGWDQYQHDAVASPPVPRLPRLQNLRKAISGTYIGKMLEGAIRYVDSEIGTLLTGIATAGYTALAFTVKLIVGLTGLIIVLIYLVFLLLDFPEYARTWQSFLPPTYRKPIVEFLIEFDLAMRRYFRGQSLVALFTCAMYALGFTLIGLPLGVPLALMIGILSMVPYLAAIAIIPGLLLAVARSVEHNSSLLASMVMLLSVFAVVQALQDTVITPRVMGRTTGLKPVIILLGVFIWGKLLGFLGILLAIPLTCLFIAYYRRYVLKQSLAATGIAT